MSWDAYVQNLENGKGHCTYAGIYGKEGQLWAESLDKSCFPITLENVKLLSNIICSQNQDIMRTGFKIGEKYNFTCLRMEPDILICQGKGEFKDFSLVIAATFKALIFAFNREPEVKTASVRDAAEVIKDYLKQAGY